MLWGMPLKRSRDASSDQKMTQVHDSGERYRAMMALLFFKSNLNSPIFSLCFYEGGVVLM